MHDKPFTILQYDFWDYVTSIFTTVSLYSVFISIFTHTVQSEILQQSQVHSMWDRWHSLCYGNVENNHTCIEKLRCTSPCTVNVDVDSSRSIDVTPDIRRACIMLAPCVPIDRPIRSLLTWNSSWKDEPCGAYDVRELCSVMQITRTTTTTTTTV